MKKATVLTVLGLLLLPTMAHADSYYMGLYASEDRACYCWNSVGENTCGRIEMWVWILPSTKGLVGAEFAIQYPSNAVPCTPTFNPDLGTRMGTLSTGIDGAFYKCEMGWVWFCHQELWVVSNVQTNIMLVPHPCCETINLASCEIGFPIYSPAILTRLYINVGIFDHCLDPFECPFVDTNTTSWGAIKSLFGE